jgi:hypothetical protein
MIDSDVFAHQSFVLPDPPGGSESTPTLSVQGDSGKDGIRRRVSRTKRRGVEKGELAKLDKIGMGIERCIDVPDRLMLPG